MSTRWPNEASEFDVEAAKFIHARLTRSDDFTLCERDGPTLSEMIVVLALDEANAENAERPVDCPKCLEWMHA
jgi:hypothetical protein